MKIKEYAVILFLESHDFKYTLSKDNKTIHFTKPIQNDAENFARCHYWVGADLLYFSLYEDDEYFEFIKNKSIPKDTVWITVPKFSEQAMFATESTTHEN